MRKRLKIIGMEIVKFKNGKYGIRKRDFLDKLFNAEGLFRDFNPSAVKWRNSDDTYFSDCQLDSFDEVVKVFNQLKFGVIEKVIKT